MRSNLKLLLLLGPTGVGKTTVIRNLRKLDDRFVYVSPFITRPLRAGENDKISISNIELDRMWAEGRLLIVNELYGVRYGTPKGTIDNALSGDLFPVLDWPIERLGIMEAAFPQRIYRVYIEPPNIEQLRERLTRRGSSGDLQRVDAAMSEVRRVSAGEYDASIDFRVVNVTDRAAETADAIYQNYIRAMCSADTRVGG